MGPAAVRRVDGAEAAQSAAANRPRGHLVGRAPPSRVAHRREAQSVLLVAAGVAQDPVDPPVVVRVLPRSVAVVSLERIQHPARAERRRGGQQHPPERVLAPFELDQGPIQRVEVIHVDGAGGGEVALLGRIGPLLELHAAHQLRNEEVVVGVTLPMGVGGHVHGDARHEGGEVRAVIEVESADVVLVGLAFPAVLADHHAGHRLERLAGPIGGPLFDETRGDDAFGARAREAEQAAHGLIEIGEVAERPAARHEDVRGQSHLEDRIHGGRRARLERDGLDAGGEAREAKGDAVATGGETRDLVGSGRVGGRRPGEASIGPIELDGDPRQGQPGLVSNGAPDARARLGRGRGHRDEEQQTR